jgi:hypothetical protein
LTTRLSVPTSIRLPFNLRRVLRKQARKEHRSISNLIIHVLDEFAIANKLFDVFPADTRQAKRRRTSDEVEADLERVALGETDG